jgi:hypothetical protein
MIINIRVFDPVTAVEKTVAIQNPPPHAGAISIKFGLADFRIGAMPYLSGLQFVDSRTHGFESCSFVVSRDRLQLSILPGDHILFSVGSATYSGFVNNIYPDWSKDKDSIKVEILGYAKYVCIKYQLGRFKPLVPYPEDPFNPPVDPEDARYHIRTLLTAILTQVVAASPITFAEEDIPVDTSFDTEVRVEFSAVDWFTAIDTLLTLASAQLSKTQREQGIAYVWYVDSGKAFKIRLTVATADITTLSAAPFRALKHAKVTAFDLSYSGVNEIVNRWLVKTLREAGPVECDWSVASQAAWGVKEDILELKFCDTLNVAEAYLNSFGYLATPVLKRASLSKKQILEIVDVTKRQTIFVTDDQSYTVPTESIHYTIDSSHDLSASFTLGLDFLGLLKRITAATSKAFEDVRDLTPPNVSLSVTQVDKKVKLSIMGSPTDFTATVEDPESGVASVVLHINDGSASPSTTYVMTQDPTYLTLYTVQADLVADFSVGSIVKCAALATDKAGNRAWSGVSEYQIDNEPPVVSVSFENDDTDEEAEITGPQVTGYFYLKINVQDASTTKEILVKRNGLTIGSLTGGQVLWDELEKRYKIRQRASSLEKKYKYKIIVTDAFNNITTHGPAVCHSRRDTEEAGGQDRITENIVDDWRLTEPADEARDFNGAVIGAGTVSLDALSSIPVHDKIQQEADPTTVLKLASGDGTHTFSPGQTLDYLAGDLLFYIDGELTTWIGTDGSFGFFDSFDGEMVLAGDILNGISFGGPLNGSTPEWGIGYSGIPTGGLKDYIDTSGGGGGFAEKIEAVLNGKIYRTVLERISETNFLTCYADADEVGEKVVFRVNLDNDTILFGDSLVTSDNVFILSPEATSGQPMFTMRSSGINIFSVDQGGTIWGHNGDWRVETTGGVGIMQGIKIGFKEG